MLVVMARWTVVVVAVLAMLGGGRGEETTTEAQTKAPSEPVTEAQALDTPRLLVQLIDEKGFNISIPNAGAVMTEFKYYVNFNQEFKEATTSVFCKGRVECFSSKSRFKLTKNREMKEGDILYFYLIGYKKAGNFQMERVYEVKKDSEEKLDFQQKSERSGLEKDGLWYQLDKLQETNN